MQHRAQFAEALHRIDVGGNRVLHRRRGVRGIDGLVGNARAGLQAVTGGGEQRVDAAVQVAEHARELVFVLAEQQRTQRLRQFGVVVRREERTGQARGADRVRRGRRTEFGRQRFEATVEHFELALVTLADRLGELLARVVEVELAFFDEAQRQVAARRLAMRQRAEVFEALRDQLAEAHHVTGVALAQIQQRDVVAAADLDQAGATRGFIQGFADRRVQCAGDATELFDGEPLHFLKHASRVGPFRGAQSQRMS